MGTKFRERDRDEEQDRPAQNPGIGGPSGEKLAAFRNKVPDLVAAGKDAIERALSGDSQAFNRASRQQSGQ